MTKTEVINLALGHVGNSTAISDPDELSEEARISNRWFDVALEELLSKRRWRFARRVSVLNLVEENPTTEWLYSYREPADCLIALKIQFYTATGSAIFNDVLSNQALGLVSQNEIAFDKSSDTDGDLIYTNADGASLEYTARIDITLCPVYFCITLSYLIAQYIYPSLAKGDIMGMLPRIEDKYDKKLVEAEARNENEPQPYRSNESAFTAARR